MKIIPGLFYLFFDPRFYSSSSQNLLKGSSEMVLVGLGRRRLPKPTIKFFFAIYEKDQLASWVSLPENTE